MRGFKMAINGLVLAVAVCAGVAKAQGYSWKSVVVGGGGFVDGFVYHPAAKGVLYARTDMGGAYRLHAATGSWLPITDWIGTASDDMGVLAIALDPNDTGKVFLLTGKYTNEWSSAYGSVLASSNGGRSFTKTELHQKVGGNMDGRGSSERLAVDPNLGSILYLAGSDWDSLVSWGSPNVTVRFKGAVWKSLDGGKTFDSIKTGPTGNGMFVLLDPSSGTKGSASKVVYAGYNGANTGLWRSIDAGANWSLVPGQPAGLIPVSASFSGGDLYVSYNDAIGPNGVKGGKLMKLSTASGAWTDVSPVKDAAFGYGTASVSGQNPNMLVVSSVNRWDNEEVWLSRDGGASWSSALQSGSIDISFAPWKHIRKVHWMAALRMNPFDSTEALFGTGYGVFRTRNLTSAKPAWFAADSNLEETVAIQLVSPPVGAPVVSAMGDQGGFRHARLDKAPENPHMPDVGTTLAIDAAWGQPQFWVKAHNGANLESTHGGYSVDSAKTWISFVADPAGIQIPSDANGWKGGGGTRSIAVSADAASIVWLPIGPAAAQVSKDSGKTWKAITGGKVVATTAIPVADRTNGQILYILDPQSGTVNKSVDGGATFVAGGTIAKLDDWEAGNAGIVSVPGREGHLWAAASHSWDDAANGLYHSVNGGTTIKKIGSFTRAYKVAVGKAATGKTYPAIYVFGTLGGEEGIFRSDDSAKKWIRINDDDHRYGTIHHLAGDMNVFGRLYMGTEGRGVVYGEPEGATSVAPSVRSAPWSIRRVGDVVVGSGTLAIELVDLRGRAIRKSEIVNGAARLELAGLPRGMYVARRGGEAMRVDAVR